MIMIRALLATGLIVSFILLSMSGVYMAVRGG